MKCTKALFGIILLLVATVFTGCKSTDIVQLSPDTYMITVEDHAGIFGSSVAALKDRTIHEANAFAESKGKIAIPVAMQGHPVGAFGQWAYCEYQFMVLDKNDPQALRTSLAAEYFQLKSESATQGQTIIQQNLAIQQQQIQDNQNSLVRTANNLELQQAQQASHPFVFPALPPGQPTMPNVGLMSQPNSMGGLTQQQEQNLPSAWEMQHSVQTGNVKFGPDGVWHEYRTASGFTFWTPDQ
jgi:hypothetical protein